MLTRVGREISLVAAIIALFVISQCFNPSFLNSRTLLTIAENALVNFPVVIGVSLVLISGNVDLSVGSILALCSITSAQLVQRGVPYLLTIFWCIFLGTFLGLMNGLVTTFFRIPSMIVTLATMTIWRGFVLWWTKGYWVTDLPGIWKFLSDFKLLQLSLSAWSSLVIAIIFIILSKRHSFFRRAYAIGSNLNAAKFWGINDSKIVLSIFMLSGFLTGISAIFNATRFFVLPSNIGTGLELNAIAAAVIGGIRITGGRGRIEGALLGTFLLTTISSSLVFWGIESVWDDAFKGLIILLTIVFDILMLGRRVNA